MKIPLFPLNIVLFPGQMLPLHIFEPRYKSMLQRCVDEKMPFGLVMVEDGGGARRGTPSSIGTSARVVEVEEVPEGRCPLPAPHRGNCYNIMCFGEERFRVKLVDRRAAEYPVGEVEPYPDEAAPAPAMAMVAGRVTSLFDEYYRSIVALMGGWQKETARDEPTMLFDIAALVRGQSMISEHEVSGKSPVLPVPVLPSHPQLLANVIAVELNVLPQVKQELLECPSALARLQREAEILAEETPQMRERLQHQIRRRFSAFGSAN